MIVGSKFPARIGERYVGTNDREGVFHPDQPYVIIREATLAEYLEDHAEHLDKMPPAQLEYLAAGRGFFYEASFD